MLISLACGADINCRHEPFAAYVYVFQTASDARAAEQPWLGYTMHDTYSFASGRAMLLTMPSIPKATVRQIRRSGVGYLMGSVSRGWGEDVLIVDEAIPIQWAMWGVCE